MRYILFTFLVTLFLSIPTFAQTTENSSIQKAEELRFLAIDENEIELAKAQGFGVFKILPRGKYEKELPSIRGGGAYYSFYYRYHDYGHGSDIELQQNQLSVGFAGADYGFLKDLGNVSLATVTKKNFDDFLASYIPPTNEPDIRKEQQKARNYEINGQIYKNQLPVMVGHTYLVRSINFGNSDVLVALNISRQKTDGSLVIFWKILEQFDTPKILTGSKNDEELLERLKHQLTEEKYKGIEFEVKDMVVTLRGNVAKADAANVTLWANDFGAKKVINLLEYK